MSALGRFLPIAILSTQRLVSGAKWTLDSDFSEAQNSPAAFINSGHSNVVDIGNLTGSKRPQAASRQTDFSATFAPA